MTANSNNFIFTKLPATVQISQKLESRQNKTKNQNNFAPARVKCTRFGTVKPRMFTKPIHFHPLGELLLLGHSCWRGTASLPPKCLKGQPAQSGTVKDRQNRQEETYGEGSSLMLLLLSENRDCSSAQMFTLCDTET